MKRNLKSQNRKNLALTLGVLMIVAATKAAESDKTSNPYSTIVERNVFKLVPPPVPASLNTDTPPPEIVLNGIMSTFGKKFALFKTLGDKKYYCLAEGQSDDQIKLLSVDDKAGAIKVVNHGVPQVVLISKMPDLSTAPEPARTGNDHPTAANENVQPSAAISSRGPENQNSSGAQIFQSGYAIVNGGSRSSASSGDNNPGAADNNSPPADSNSQNTGGSGSPKSHDPWWVVAARNVEASRLVTAGLVSSGQADPYPLTPLTPPGTPANLIGEGQLYFVPAAR